MKKLIFLLCMTFLVGCSLQSREDQISIRRFFEQKQFVKASDLLEKSELKNDPKNKLLYLMEKGTLEYYQRKFKAAADTFVLANDLVDKLYTKSIREKLVSSILNDNSETFYASIFERSLLYYYQAMSFYSLSLEGKYTVVTKDKNAKDLVRTISLSKKEIMMYKQSARSSLVAWDSFFAELKRIKGNHSIQKDDLVCKIVSAKLHFLLGTRSDKQISLQLFKDARKLLINIGPTQQIFNNKFTDYNKELKEFYKYNTNKKSLKSKDLTASYDKTLSYLNLQILKLTKQIRSYAFKKEVKSLGPTSETLKEVLTNNNVEIILELKHVNELTSRDFSFNLESVLEDIKDPTTKSLVNSIGIPILTYFAMGPLGLGYATHHDNVSIYSSHRAGDYVTKQVGIEFEMPYVKPEKESSTYRINILSGEELVRSKKLIDLSSISSSAFINSQEMIESSFRARSLRVGIKYAVAIAAAFSTYSAVKENHGELFAKPAAFTQFLVSSKGIKETEKADIRHWSTLPSRITTGSFKLPTGHYRVQVQRVSTEDPKKPTTAIDLGDLEVKSQEPTLFSYRLF